MRGFAPVIHARGFWHGSINESLRQISVGINPPVAQERPVRARHVHLAEVNGHNQNFLFARAGPGKDFAGRSGHKTLSPEFNAPAREFFMADTINDGDVTTVGDSVRTLNGFPGVVLVHAVFLFFTRMPADGCRVKQDLRLATR